MTQSRSPRTLDRRSIVRASALIAAGLAVGTPVARAQEGTTKVSLALDWYPNANHAGIYMALDRGYFAEAGIEVEVVVPADPSTVLQTVGAGRDTFGISYQTEVLFARAQDVPVVSVAALVQHPLNSVMVLQDSGIASIADLKGKKVAVTGLPTDEAYLATMLGQEGLTLDDVEIVNVGFDLLPAVISGKTDAVIGVYWTHETILAEREGHPVTVFKVEEHGVPDYYELVLVTGDSTLGEDEAMVRGFLGALQRGYVDAIGEPDVALELLVAASPDLDREVETEGIALLSELWTDGGTVAFGTQTEPRWTDFGQWMKDQGLLDSGVDIAAAWRGDLLPESTPATPEASPAG